MLAEKLFHLSDVWQKYHKLQRAGTIGGSDSDLICVMYSDVESPAPGAIRRGGNGEFGSLFRPEPCQ